MLSLPVNVDGEGDPAIIQAPGWGPGSDYLRSTLVPLLDGLRTLTYDTRNTGRAERRPGADSQATEVLVADLEGVRLRHGFEWPVLLGHSHGAFVAMAYAVRHPGRLRGLVLLTPSLNDPGASPETRRLLCAYEGDPARADAVRWYRERPRDGTSFDNDRELARWLRRSMPVNFYDLEALHRFQRALIGSPAPSLTALRGMPAQREPWVAAGLAQLEVPTLIVAGDHDVTTPPSEAEEVRSLIPGSRLVVLEKAGHNPWFERPKAFRAAMRDFIEDLPPARCA